MERLISFFQPPRFEDATRVRKAALLNTILLISAVLVFVYALSLPFTNLTPIPGLIMMGLLETLLVILYFVFKRGHVRIVSIILIASGSILSGGSAYFFGGVFSPSYLSLTIMIVLAALLVSTARAGVLTLVSSLYGIILVVIDNNGLLPAPLSPATPASFLGGVITNMVIILLFVGLSNRNTNKAFANLRESREKLNQRNEELVVIQESLEGTVRDRTGILERRARLIEAAADVGRAATSIYNLDELLPQVTKFIAERFGYYHVGIFLLDDLNEFAVLRAANSEGGRRLMARGLKLQVGQEGIIGYVTGSGEAHVVADIQQDEHYIDAPELPETQSEIALPLFAGGRLFGALDVQSTDPFAFAEEDVNTLRVLADQVSMAINNATLFEQLQSSLESERRAYGVVSKKAWQNILNAKTNLGYRYKNNETMGVSGAWSPMMMNAAASQKSITSAENGQHTLAVPITSANEVIGIMYLKKGTEQTLWGDDEISMIEDLSIRLSQALDSARLFEETQQQASYQQLSSEVSSAMRETLEIDSVLRTAAQELGEAFKAKEVVIRLNSQKR